MTTIQFIISLIAFIVLLIVAFAYFYATWKNKTFEAEKETSSTYERLAQACKEELKQLKEEVKELRAELREVIAEKNRLVGENNILKTVKPDNAIVQKILEINEELRTDLREHYEDDKRQFDALFTEIRDLKNKEV